VGLFAHLVLRFPLIDGLLLGAIVSSTDAAAVFSILRGHGVGLKGKLGSLLEFESGSNDPVAAFLTVALVRIAVDPTPSWGTFLISFALQLPLGALAGYATGRMANVLLNRVRLDYEGLYPVFSSGLALLTYGIAELIRGNGFLAVYVLGLVLGNNEFLHKRRLSRFHDGLAWLMQIAMFLTLGLLVFPSRLPPVAPQGLLLAIFLMFVARPAAVLLCLIRSGYGIREKVLIGWAGLRGAVPIVLATFPFLEGHPRSDLIFNLVFFVVLASILVQGHALMPLARLLGLDRPGKNRPRSPLEFEPTGQTKNETREYDVLPGTFPAGRRISDLGLPEETLILLVRRGERFLLPKGGTTLREEDTLQILAAPETFPAIRRILTAEAPPGREDPDRTIDAAPDGRERRKGGGGTDRGRIGT
jgi:cell volume regulation protein A